jgi:DNA-binding CsgD family transcriptional regulator/tetratricopeptide (TPR) repeat protein
VLCPEIIGRERDLEEINYALEDAGSGEGSVLAVVGEAGVGKSRLVREGVAAARRSRLTVLFGRAVQGQSTVPYRPIAEALNSYFRDEGPPDLPELAPFRPILGALVPEWRQGDRVGIDDSAVVLAEAVLRLLHVLGRRAGGCLLVLEDLHWADPETLAIVEYLAANLDPEPVVCLATLRSEASPALGLVRSLAAGRTASLVELTRLEPPEVQAVACACLATPELPEQVADLLAAHADGLPFFVEELLASVVSSGALVREGDRWVVARPLTVDVPDNFVASVERRLLALGEAAPVVTAAATLGRSFDWSLLPAMTGVGEMDVLASLRAAVDAQLLTAEPTAGGSFRFRHALTCDAVAGRLLPMERALLSRRALEAVRAATPGLPDETCELAAELAERAGDPAGAAALLVESGRRSLARGALASAEITLGRARELATDPAVAADATEALTEALSLAGNTDRALVVGEELAAALEAMDAAPERRGGVQLRLARAATTACRWEVADAHLARGRSWAAQAGDDALAARLDAIAAQVAFGRGEIERADELARSALAVAQRLDLHDLTSEAWEQIGRCARMHDLRGAEAAFEQSLAVAERHGLTVWRIRALSELGFLDILAIGRRDRLQAVRDLAVASGALGTAAHVNYFLAIWHLDRGEPERVIPLAREASGVARRFKMQQLTALAVSIEGVASGRLGRREEMEALFAEAQALVGEEPAVTGLAWSTGRAVCTLIGEDRRRTLECLDTAMGHLRNAPWMANPERGLWALLRTIDDRGPGTTGAAARGEVEASGVAIHHMNAAFLALAEAVAHGRAGRKEEAELAFDAAEAALEPVPWWRNVARRIVAEPAISDGWGDPVTWLREALPDFEERGQDRLAAATRSLLQKAGAPMPRKRQDDQVPSDLREYGISRRELEVLILLAEGLQNKEIADRLYLSPRTVERHIANMTAKTGLRTRSELIAFAARNAGIG